METNVTFVVLLLVIAMSTLAGWYFSHIKEAEKPVKVMIFVLYFWGFVFLQLIILAILYQFGAVDFLQNNGYITD